MKAKLITADGAFRWWNVGFNRDKPSGWERTIRFALARKLTWAVQNDGGLAVPEIRYRDYEFTGFDELDGHTLVYKEIVT